MDIGKTVIRLGGYAMQNDKYYPEANKFIPERWLRGELYPKLLNKDKRSNCLLILII